MSASGRNLETFSRRFGMIYCGFVWPRLLERIWAASLFCEHSQSLGFVNSGTFDLATLSWCKKTRDPSALSGKAFLSCNILYSEFWYQICTQGFFGRVGAFKHIYTYVMVVGLLNFTLSQPHSIGFRCTSNSSGCFNIRTAFDVQSLSLATSLSYCTTKQTGIFDDIAVSSAQKVSVSGRQVYWRLWSTGPLDGGFVIGFLLVSQGSLGSIGFPGVARPTAFREIFSIAEICEIYPSIAIPKIKHWLIQPYTQQKTQKVESDYPPGN